MGYTHFVNIFFAIFHVPPVSIFTGDNYTAAKPTALEIT